MTTMRLTNRFDPIPDKPYGVNSAGETFATEEDARKWCRAHEGKSIAVTNPPRSHRIEYAIADICYEALSCGFGNGFEDVDALIQDKHITADEAHAAVAAAGYGEAWQHFCQEMQE